jgi:hypothetical protein
MSNTEPQQTVAPTTGNIAERAGINTNLTGEEDDRDSFNTMVDVGNAAGMARSFGGVGLAFGIGGILAGETTPSPEPTILVEYPAGTNIKAKERHLAELLYRASGFNPEAAGYQRPADADQFQTAVFIKPGCQKTRHGYYKRTCSTQFIASLLKGKTANIYSVLLTGIPEGVSKESVLRKMVSYAPKELALYIPPKTVNGTQQPARLIENGKERSL